MSVFWYQVYQARLWERLLTSRGFLPSDSTCVLKALPGKLGIKRREPGILFISLPIVQLFKLAIMTWLSNFLLIQRPKRRHSKRAMSSWPDRGGHMSWDGHRLSGNVQQCSFICEVTDKNVYQHVVLFFLPYMYKKITGDAVWMHWLVWAFGVHICKTIPFKLFISTVAGHDVLCFCTK